jgi:hypothetical protein
MTLPEIKFGAMISATMTTLILFHFEFTSAAPDDCILSVSSARGGLRFGSNQTILSN